MAENQESTIIKDKLAEELSQGYQFQLANYQEEEFDCDLDLEEKYFEKLKEQRKRIQELSQLHHDYEEKLQKEIDKNKSLRDEIERLSSHKEYQVRYNQTVINLQSISQENKTLKEQNQDLKQQVYQSSLDKTSQIQKLKLEVSLLRDKQSAKIQSLEEELYSKQQEIDKLTRQFRGKEKQYQESISNLRIKFANLQSQKDEAVRLEQRKVQKLQKELIFKSQNYTQSQLNNESLLKELNRSKQENYRLNGLIASKDLQLKSLNQKLKKHMYTCRKESANKQKECHELKQYLRKYEKEAKDSCSEADSLRTEVKKIKDTIQIEKARLQNDFLRERKDLQATIAQHIRTIEQLLEIKNVLMTEKSKLQAILKKKTDCENKRLNFLKSEWKEINKLEKVIDKIID